jgi:hypothetical protein
MTPNPGGRTEKKKMWRAKVVGGGDKENKNPPI